MKEAHKTHERFGKVELSGSQLLYMQFNSRNLDLQIRHIV